MLHLDRAAVGALGWIGAIGAVRAVLTAGLDPEQEPLRTSTAFGPGELLIMPAVGARDADGRRLAGLKLATVAPDNPARGLLRVHALYVLFDADTLALLATVDGTALTNLRTPAVSALGVQLVAPAEASRLVVFGSGPQAYGHVHALRAVRPIRSVGVVGRDPARTAGFVARLRAEGFVAEAATPTAVTTADLVACCTTAREPLFEGALLGDQTVVLACGSHEPDAREVDTETVRRCGALVEARTVARREAGDLVIAAAEGVPGEPTLTLAELVEAGSGGGPRPMRLPRLVKTVGMGWQDLAVAAAVLAVARSDP